MQSHVNFLLSYSKICVVLYSHLGWTPCYFSRSHEQSSEEEVAFPQQQPVWIQRSELVKYLNIEASFLYWEVRRANKMKSKWWLSTRILKHSAVATHTRSQLLFSVWNNRSPELMLSKQSWEEGDTRLCGIKLHINTQLLSPEVFSQLPRLLIHCFTLFFTWE